MICRCWCCFSCGCRIIYYHIRLFKFMPNLNINLIILHAKNERPHWKTFNPHTHTHTYALTRIKIKMPTLVMNAGKERVCRVDSGCWENDSIEKQKHCVFFFTYMHICNGYGLFWHNVCYFSPTSYFAIVFLWSKNMRMTALLAEILTILHLKRYWMLVHSPRSIVHDIYDDLYSKPFPASKQKEKKRKRTLIKRFNTIFF